MLNSSFLRRAQTAALCALTLIAAVSCGGESPESMLSSAKDYLAKKDTKTAIIQIKNALQKNADLPEGRYLLGRALLDSGEAAAAELELRKARALQYSPDMVLPALARSTLLQGQFKKMIDEFGAATLNTVEAKADLDTSIGTAHAALGNRLAAETAIARALAAAPSFAPALMAQARLKASTGDTAGALEVADKLLSANAAHYEGWKIKGDLLLAKNSRDEALAAYRKAVEVKPDYAVGYAALVSVLSQAGKSDDASQALEQMKKNVPKHFLTAYVTAQHAFQKKDFKAARDLIDPLLKQAPGNPAVLELAGAVEFQLKSYARAEDYFLKALQAVPDSLPVRHQLVLTHLRRGQSARALTALEPMLVKIDRDANMLALAGEVFMQNNNIAKADEYFVKAAKLDPDDPAKKTSLALTQMAAGKVDAASAELEKISAADKGTTADMALIVSYLRRNEIDKALKAINALDKKQPDNPATHNLRGRTLMSKRDVAAARQDFERAVQIDPAYLPAVISLAGLDLLDKNVPQAKKRFETLLAADPKNTGAMLAAGELAARTGGTPEEILGWITKAITANPSDSAARLALIEHYLRNKDPKKAASAAQEALAALPDRPELLDAVGRAQAAAGDTNQALITFGRLSTQQPDSPAPFIRMAEVQAAGGQRDAAVQTLQRALKIKPDLLEAQRALVMLHLALNQQNEAVAMAREVQKQRPNEAAGFVLEGDIHTAKNDAPRAVPFYRAAFKQMPVSQVAVKLHTALLASSKGEAVAFAQSWTKANPNDAEFLLHLGNGATAVKDYPAAIAHYENALTQQPANPIILNNLAWVLGQTKSPKAVEYAEKANQLAPNQPAILDTLAMVLAEKGDTVRSLEMLEQATKLAPQAASIQLNYAKVLIKAGKKSEARKSLEALAKLGERFNQQAEVTQLLAAL